MNHDSRFGYVVARREQGRGTRAISLVISRGFGTHVQLTLWWFRVAWHRRDQELERYLRESGGTAKRARV